VVLLECPKCSWTGDLPKGSISRRCPNCQEHDLEPVQATPAQILVKRQQLYKGKLSGPFGMAYPTVVGVIVLLLVSLGVLVYVTYRQRSVEKEKSSRRVACLSVRGRWLR
jgi:hypothetical protein